MALGEDHAAQPSQADLGVIQHLFSSLPHPESTEREDPRSRPPKFPSWGQRRSSRDFDAPIGESSESCRGCPRGSLGAIVTEAFGTVPVCRQEAEGGSGAAGVRASVRVSPVSAAEGQHLLQRLGSADLQR